MVAIRAHCNALEQLPIFAIVMIALTYVGASTMLLSTLVIGFTLARLFHAYAMLYRVFVARGIGAGFTYILQFIATISVGVLLVN